MFTLSRAQIQCKSKILGPGKIQRKITQLHLWSANIQIRASRLLIWIKIIHSLKSREHCFLLQHTIEDDDFDIFTISETWLDSTVDNQAVQIPGFVFFRQDREEHKSGGGLTLYIRETFKATLLEHASGISDENFQQLWIKVQVWHCKSIFICTVYRPPGTTLAFSNSLSRSLLDVLLHGNDIIILGDLNCNILDDTVDSRTFKELCASFNLTHLVKEPKQIAR